MSIELRQKTQKLHPNPYERRRENPDEWKKILCRARTAYAVKAGFLAKQPCECCGETKVQAHHEDYDRPYMVRWLCAPCHKDVHDYVKLPPKEFEPEEMMVVKYSHGEARGKYSVKNLKWLRYNRTKRERARKRHEYEQERLQKLSDMLLDWVPTREPAKDLVIRLLEEAKATEKILNQMPR